jgi:two-component system, sensor histidine kinase and response regulator
LRYCVWTDRTIAAVVRDNLVSNAVKFSPLDNFRIWGTIEEDAESATCVVRDEGPGFTPEEQARIFAPDAHIGPKPTGGELRTATV